jgi:hypothetical protein
MATAGCWRTDTDRRDDYRIHADTRCWRTYECRCAYPIHDDVWRTRIGCHTIRRRMPEAERHDAFRTDADTIFRNTVKSSLGTPCGRPLEKSPSVVTPTREVFSSEIECRDDIRSDAYIPIPSVCDAYFPDADRRFQIKRR